MSSTSSTTTAAANCEWFQAKDAKGRIFYANRRTRETQWEMPLELQRVEKLNYLQKKNTKPTLPPSSRGQRLLDQSRKSELPHANPNNLEPNHRNNNNQIKQGYNPHLSTIQQTADYGIYPNKEEDYLYEQCQQKKSSFKVYHVPDEQRSSCQGCHLLFNAVGRRKHHCRSCGDVFCLSCSSQKCQLPGSDSTNNQARVCNICYSDIIRNHLPFRRYLPTFQLFHDDFNTTLRYEDVISALASFTTDLHSMLSYYTSSDAATGIPPAEILVPAIGRILSLDLPNGGEQLVAKMGDLSSPSTQQLHLDMLAHAVNALATLLALGSIMGDTSFACAVYSLPTTTTTTDTNHPLLQLLLVEKDTWDFKHQKNHRIRTMAIKEQAVRALFYLTEKSVIEATILKDDSSSSMTDSIPIPNALQLILDPTMMLGATSSFQRWCAATIRNLVIEDYRRTSLCSSSCHSYESFLYSESFQSSGSVGQLCSLMSAEDADTRSHATFTLTFIVNAVMKNETKRLASIAATVVRQISENACGHSLSQLLCSADNSIATSGCEFALSFLSPLLKQPLLRRNNNSAHFSSTLLLSNKAAALAIATQESCCLAVFVQIARIENKRPVILRSMAITCLAAICIACSATNYNAEDAASDNVAVAIAQLQKEEVGEMCTSILFQSSQSNLLFNVDDNPSSQLLEAAAIALSAILDCSPTRCVVPWTKKVIFDLISLANERAMQRPSKLQGQWALRCLPFINCASKLMHGVLIDCVGTTTDALDCLLEALDAGALSLAVGFISQDAYSIGSNGLNNNELCGQVMLQISACRLFNALICLANNDDTLIGRKRLEGAIVNGNLVSPAIGLITLAASVSHQQDEAVGLALLHELIETGVSLLGSLFGAPFLSYSWASSSISHDKGIYKEADSTKIIDCFNDVSSLFISGKDTVTSTTTAMLVGVFGEGCIDQMLRLICATASDDLPEHLRRKVAHSGMLVPVIDLLQNSCADQFRSRSCITIIRCYSPYVTSEVGMVSSLRSAVGTIAKGLAPTQSNCLEVYQCISFQNRKFDCIRALEAMSKNPSLWNAIASCLPLIAAYIDSIQSSVVDSDIAQSSICTALRTIRNVIQQPSHALSTANSRVPESLCRLITKYKIDPTSRNKAKRTEENSTMESYGNDAQVLALVVLKTIAAQSGPLKRDDSGLVRLLDCGYIDAACVVLVERGVVGCDFDFAETIVNSALSLIQTFFCSDVEKSNGVEVVISALEKHRGFAKTLCATVVTAEENLSDEPFAKSLYGSPLVFESLGTTNSYQAAITLLMGLASFYVLNPSTGDHFWKFFFKEDEHVTHAATATAACLALLSWSIERNNAACPSALQLYIGEAICDVKKKILQCICKNILSYNSATDVASDNILLTIIIRQKIPDLCLEMCSIYPDLVLPVCTFLQVIHDQSPDSFPNLLSTKRNLHFFLVILQCAACHEADASSQDEVRTLCGILLELSRPSFGMLVTDFGMKTAAIHALVSVFNVSVRVENNSSPSCDAMRLSESALWCLLSIAFPYAILDRIRDGSETLLASDAQLDISEGEALASAIGGPMSLMILDKLIHSVSSKMLEDGGRHNSDGNLQPLLRSPEVFLICALSSNRETLSIICQHGGLEAIMILAHEQDFNAISALLEAAKQDPRLIVESEGQNCIVDVICSLRCAEDTSHPIMILCLEFLVTICESSCQGRLAVANSPKVAQSINVICDLMLQMLLYNANNEEQSEPQNRTNLLTLSFSYLTALSRYNLHRKQIAENDALLEMCLGNATEESFDIACEAVKLLASLAPRIANGCSCKCSPSNLADIFCLVMERFQFHLQDGLETYQDSATSVKCYHLLSSAVSGLECVFDHIACASREALVSSASHCFETLAILVEKISREIVPVLTASAAGLLAYNLTNLFITMSKLDPWRKILLTDSLIAPSMCRMIISYQTDSGEEKVPQALDTLHWKAARTNCLQCISSILCIDSSTHLFTSGLEHTTSISLLDDVDIHGNGDGNVDRGSMRLKDVRLCEFISAVERIALLSSDAVAAVTASSILSKLE